MKKKNIDRVFQENFKDFEASPNPQVWERIKTSMNQNDSKGIIFFPLWAKLSGIAALLAVLFFVGKAWVFHPSTPGVVNSTAPNIEKNATTLPKTRTIRTADSVKNNSFTQIKTEGKKKEDQTELSTPNPTKRTRFQEKLAADLKSGAHKNLDEQPHSSKRTVDLNTEVAQNKITDKTDNVEPSDTIKNDHIAEEDSKKTRSLYDEIAKQQESESKDNNKEIHINQRFAVQPNAAPIYYNSFGGGSALDPKFSDNQTKGKVTASYGIDINYKVSKNLKLRSGISKVDLQYHTPDIAYFSAAPEMELRALSPRNTVESDVVISTVSRKNLRQESEMSTVSGISSASAYTEGEFRQELSYLEVPIEVVYTLVNRRFGVHLIGGTSALLLHDDKVQVHSEMESRTLGRAENINSFSFTGNLGVGFSYRLTEFMDLNIEPTFKYQFNGFKGATGDFKPYFIGLYSGVSFKF